MKAILKFLLLVVVTIVAFIIVSALLPYSDGFKEANKRADPTVLLYVLISVACICGVMIYVVRNAGWKGRKLLLGLTFVLFFAHSFMTQIETLFFHSAFKLLSNVDIWLIMLANGMLAFAGVPLCIKLFGNTKENSPEENTKHKPSDWRELTAQLLLIGIAYVIVYFVFGYFVAWQEEDLRVFYSGRAEDEGFIASMITNYRTNPVIYPFQFLRGILFGLFVLPLRFIFDNSRQLLISLVLVLSTTGMMLIIPNVLFPDSVRWAHFCEMISSMFVFSIIVWLVFDKVKWTK